MLGKWFCGVPKQYTAQKVGLVHMCVNYDIYGISSITSRALPNPTSGLGVEEIGVHLQHQSRRGRTSLSRLVCSRVVFVC